jgi:hypothetical protein
MLIKSFQFFLFSALLLVSSSCSVQYSMTGTATTASSISIAEFYNNADLGPANMGQTFTNELKNYFVRNSSLSVVQQEGQLSLEGEITTFSLTPIAPVATDDPNGLTSASATRLTITVKATYIDTINDKMSFKDKTFSFYKDFPNELNVSDIEDTYVRQVFERIINDIFNASVANW